MSWSVTKFKDFVTLQRGFDLPINNMKEGDVPVLGSNCIVGYHNEAKVAPPGVVTGRSGTLGFVQYTESPYWPHNTALWVKDFKSNYPKFVYYKLQTLHLESYNSGVSVPTLNRNFLDTVNLRIPNYSVQEKVASILSAYDDLIENNNRRIKLLEEAARLLYQEWFVCLRFPGYEHTRIVNGVPEGWEKCRVSDFGDVITGKTPSTRDADNYGGGILFVKTPDMHGNVYVIQTETQLTDKGADTQKEKYVPAGTLLVSCIGTIGVVSITSMQSQFNQQINAVIPSEKVFRYYYYFAFKELKPKMEAIGGGATMGNVNKTKFENMEVIRPTSTLIRDYDDYCTPMFQQILTLSLLNQKLNAARDLLLPRLMSGDIQV